MFAEDAYFGGVEELLCLYEEYLKIKMSKWMWFKSV